ncbi:hypothetical protein F5051DRAFT_409439 [Lentinula edodes]|nr:hypothetical protein F5051DRAFT_409439 [Lentinula edodes]KAJ3890358.1 hypothetical protein GG344DRAFT_77928 [Lentinula edodes]KAJ3919096.1 hypothetical protein F5877DRAFT_78393 [Lentinula edodes]
MGYKRYPSYSRRIIIIPGIFLFILCIQHIFFATTFRNYAKSHDKIRILGQWKDIRRELGLPTLPDELAIPSKATHSPQDSLRSSRFFKLIKRNIDQPNALPELFFASDALEEPNFSYEEWQKSLAQIVNSGQEKRNHGRKRKLSGEIGG